MTLFTAPSPAARRWRSLFFCVFILLLAAATRLHDLGVRSLWEDEGWTLVLAKGPDLPDIVQRMAFDQHPPLYFVAIHYWRDLTGSSEFALRMLSVLTGLMAVAGIYQLGRAMFGEMAGLMAAFVLALSDHHIDLSQDARHYAQLATLIILSCWYYFRFIQPQNPSRGTRIGYVLISAALLYSHYLGGFVLVCQVIHAVVFVRPWRHLRWFLFHFGAICVAFLPWLPVMIRQNQVRWDTPLYYLNALPNSHQTYLMVRDALLGKQYAITLVLVLVGLVWLYYERSSVVVRFRPMGPVIFVVAWVAVYILVTVYMNERRQFLTVRNFIVVTPGIALLVGHGLANLQAGVRTLMVGVLLVLAITTVDTRQLKVPWREVFQTVTDYHNSDEPVLMDIWVGDFPGRYYVEQQIGPETPWLSVRETRDEYVTQFLPIMLTYVRDREAFWVVYWRSVPIEESDYAPIFEEAGFQRTASFFVPHAGDQIFVHRYDKVPESQVAQYLLDDRPLFTLHEYRVKETNGGVRVQVLWSAEETPAVDYNISLFLLNADGILEVNRDELPISANAYTSRWPIDQLMFDQHTLAFPERLAPGEYTLGLKIYYYQTPNTPLKATCADDAERLCDWVVLETITIP